MAATYLKLWIIFSLVVGTFSRTDIFNDFQATNMEEVNSLCSKAVLIRTSDGYVFTLDEKISCQSVTLRNMISEYPSAESISLPNITSNTLAKVMEYYNKYYETQTTEDGSAEFKRWESEFIQVHYNTLFNLIRATNELQLKQLYELTAGTVGKMMLGKSVEEIREMFNITSDCVRNESRSVEEHNLASE